MHKNWLVRGVTMAVEAAALGAAYLWVGWEGPVIFAAGSVVVGLDRFLIREIETRRG